MELHFFPFLLFLKDHTLRGGTLGSSRGGCSFSGGLPEATFRADWASSILALFSLQIPKLCCSAVFLFDISDSLLSFLMPSGDLDGSDDLEVYWVSNRFWELPGLCVLFLEPSGKEAFSTGETYCLSCDLPDGSSFPLLSVSSEKTDNSNGEDTPFFSVLCRTLWFLTFMISVEGSSEMGAG